MGRVLTWKSQKLLEEACKSPLHDIALGMKKFIRALEVDRTKKFMIMALNIISLMPRSVREWCKVFILHESLRLCKGKSGQSEFQTVSLPFNTYYW